MSWKLIMLFLLPNVLILIIMATPQHLKLHKMALLTLMELLPNSLMEIMLQTMFLELFFESEITLFQKCMEIWVLIQYLTSVMFLIFPAILTSLANLDLVCLVQVVQVNLDALLIVVIMTTLFFYLEEMMMDDHRHHRNSA